MPHNPAYAAFFNRTLPQDQQRPVMAKPDPETTAHDDETITRGTGNVFAGLCYADAEERHTKLRLAYAINTVIARRRLTLAAAAEKLHVNQPKVSALANYRLDGFSVERLMIFLTALDQDVEIVIRNKPRSRRSGKISVIAGAGHGAMRADGGAVAGPYGSAYRTGRVISASP